MSDNYSPAQTAIMLIGGPVLIIGVIMLVIMVYRDVTGITEKTHAKRVAAQQAENQVRIMRCWDMKGMPVLNRDFEFEQCHLRERP